METITGGWLSPSNTGTTLISDFWSCPERVAVNENGESIEMIYKQVSTISYTVYPPLPQAERVFKIVYSCVDGKWNKSEPIFGKIVPMQDEYYEFEN